jgi:hypothetical protein
VWQQSLSQPEGASGSEAEEEPDESRPPQNEPQEGFGEQAQPPEASGRKEGPDEPRTPQTEPPQNEPEDSDGSVELVAGWEEEALVAGWETGDPTDKRPTNDQVRYALWLVGFFEVRSSRNKVNAETVKAGFKIATLANFASHPDKVGKVCARDTHAPDTSECRALLEARKTIKRAYKWGTVQEPEWEPDEFTRNTRPKCVEGLKEKEVARKTAKKLAKLARPNPNDLD